MIELGNMKEKREILNKEIAERLIKTKGESRGMSLKGDVAYVLAKKGEAGLMKWKEELEKVGCPIEYDKIKILKFYPLSWRAISLLVLKKIFSWGDKEFKDLGKFEFSVSMPAIVRIFMKFFYSIDIVIRDSGRIYDKYFTIGELTIPDFSYEKRYIIARIRGVDLVPEFCRVLEGFFESIMGVIGRNQMAECSETKCTFRGDECHEFLIKW